MAHLRRIAEVFTAIKSEYVDPVDEASLVNGCTEGMETWLAARNMPLAPVQAGPQAATPGAQIGNFAAHIRMQYPDALDDGRLADACLEKMVGKLDRLSAYLDRESFRELRSGIGPIGGLGLEIGIEDGFAKIVGTIEDGPGRRSDLQDGDLILSIDGTSTGGLALKDVVKLLRGKPGSTVLLTLRRRGAAEPIQRELTREVIRIQSARSKVTPDGFLYVRISTFQEATPERLAAALRSAWANPPGVAGVILDLRDNTGGLLTSCVAVSAAFLPASTLVVDLRGRTKANSVQKYARPGDYLRGRAEDPLKDLPPAVKSVPLAVIVNGKSAACSEIVAAAMQDHGRGKVLGERTFGAGSIQTIMPIGPDTALKITTSRFFRPNGEAIDSNAVAPDLAVGRPASSRSMGAADDPVWPVAHKALLGH
jgi:carboxyl-terminal processing protease